MSMCWKEMCANYAALQCRNCGKATCLAHSRSYVYDTDEETGAPLRGRICDACRESITARDKQKMEQAEERRRVRAEIADWREE